MRGSGHLGIEVERTRLAAGLTTGVRMLSATRIVLFEAGAGQAVIAGRHISARRGRLLLIPPTTATAWQVDTPGLDLIQLRLRTRCLAPQHPIDRLALEALRRCWSWARRSGSDLALGRPVIRSCARILRQLVETGQPLALKAGILDLLAVLSEAIPPEVRPAEFGSSRRGVADAVAHLERSTDRPFAIDEVCAIAGLRRSRFDQAFRAATGVPAATFHRRLRLDRAAERLRDPEADLLDVALDHGWSGLSRFYADFTRAFGQPPGRWRRQAAAPRRD